MLGEIMKCLAIITKEDNIYVAKDAETHVASQGKTPEEATKNLQEALILYEDAVDKAVTKCVEDGVLSGFLSEHRAEVKEMFLTEYDAEKTMDLFKAEWKAEGRATMVYEMVQDGDTTPEKGAKRLGITVEQLKANMLNTGYKFPE